MRPERGRRAHRGSRDGLSPHFPRRLFLRSASHWSEVRSSRKCREHAIICSISPHQRLATVSRLFDSQSEKRGQAFDLSTSQLLALEECVILPNTSSHQYTHGVAAVVTECVNLATDVARVSSGTPWNDGGGRGTRRFHRGNYRSRLGGAKEKHVQIRYCARSLVECAPA